MFDSVIIDYSSISEKDKSLYSLMRLLSDNFIEADKLSIIRPLTDEVMSVEESEFNMAIQQINSLVNEHTTNMRESLTFKEGLTLDEQNFWLRSQETRQSYEKRIPDERKEFHLFKGERLNYSPANLPKNSRFPETRIPRYSDDSMYSRRMSSLFHEQNFPWPTDCIVFSNQPWVQKTFLAQDGLNSKVSILMLASAGLEFSLPGFSISNYSEEHLLQVKEKLGQERNGYLSAITKIADESYCVFLPTMNT